MLSTLDKDIQYLAKGDPKLREILQRVSNALFMKGAIKEEQLDPAIFDSLRTFIINSIAEATDSPEVSNAPFIVPFIDPLIFYLSNGNVQQTTLTSNDISDSSIVGTSKIGDILTVIYIQDSTGGWSVPFPPNLVGGILPSIKMNANESTYITYQQTGIGWRFHV